MIIRSSGLWWVLCVWLAIALFASGCAGTPAPTPTRVRPTFTPSNACNRVMYVCVDSGSRANIRSAPSLSASVVGKADRGDRVCAHELSSDGEWWRVTVDVLRGYIYKNLLCPQPVPTAQPKPTATPATPCSCAGNLYNCSDFPTQSAAQACYRHCLQMGRGDIH